MSKVVLDEGVNIPNAQEYLNLKYILQTDKKIYVKGEPIFFSLFVSNTSDKTLPIRTNRYFTDYHITKKRKWGKKLPVILLPINGSIRNRGWIPIVNLQHGEKVAITTRGSKVEIFTPEPGSYCACVHLDSIFPGMKYVPPVQTNEVEFEIVESSYVIQDDLVDPGRFENPPDKEEQP